MLNGKVYFFGARDGSLIKIGYTSDPLTTRKAALLRGQLIDIDLVLLVAVPGTSTHERAVKDHFAHLRLDVNSTEAFRPDPELLEYINYLRQQWWVFLNEDDIVDTAPSWNEWMPTTDRRVGFMEEDPYDLVPRHLTYIGPLAGTPWNKLSTPTPKLGDDFYTDPALIEAAREAMGGTIDLDAASHWLANKEHKIPYYFHLGRSAFDNKWARRDGGPANVWLNPPYGDNAPWFEQIVKYWDSGDIQQLCMLSPIWAFNTQQARAGIMRRVSAMILLSPAPSFWGNPKGRKGTNHPHGIIYLGNNAKRFLTAFDGRGIPMKLALKEHETEKAICPNCLSERLANHMQENVE